MVNKKTMENAHMSVCLVIGVWIVYLGTQGARTIHARGQDVSVHFYDLYTYEDKFLGVLS